MFVAIIYMDKVKMDSSFKHHSQSGPARNAEPEVFFWLIGSTPAVHSFYFGISLIIYLFQV